MAFPEKIRAALDEHGLLIRLAPATITEERQCEGASFHSPQPLVVREVALSEADGGLTAWLCGTCRDNLHLLQALLAATGGELPWPVRREFGNKLRSLAIEGWKHGAGCAGGESGA